MTRSTPTAELSMPWDAREASEMRLQADLEARLLELGASRARLADAKAIIGGLSSFLEGYLDECDPPCQCERSNGYVCDVCRVKGWLRMARRWEARR